MADPRESWNDQDEAMRLTVDRHLGTVWTALPVRILEDSDGHVCKCQSTIKGWQKQQNGRAEPVEISHFGEVPINFPAGGGLTATHPVKEADEGLAIFSSRCIDGWHEKGGVQQEPYRRRHSLSDAILIPGVRNKPRQLDPPPSTTSYQIRLDSGQHYVELDKDGVCHIYARQIYLHAPNIELNGNSKQIEGEEGKKHYGSDKEEDTHVEIKGWLHVTRDIDCDQNIHAKQNITADQNVTARQEVRSAGETTAFYDSGRFRLSQHRHSGVQAGGAQSGPPIPGS